MYNKSCLFSKQSKYKIKSKSKLRFAALNASAKFEMRIFIRNFSQQVPDDVVPLRELETTDGRLHGRRGRPAPLRAQAGAGDEVSITTYTS